jgi:hypothetical protein
MKAYFQNISKFTVKIRPDIEGPILHVKSGEIVLAPVSTFKDLPNFKFVRPEHVVLSKPNDDDVVKHKTDTGFEYGTIKVEEKVIKPVVIEKKKTIDDPVLESTRITGTEEGETKEELLAKIRSMNKGQLFSLTKNSMLEMLHKLDADPTEMKGSRQDLMKLLKKIIDNK